MVCVLAAVGIFICAVLGIKALRDISERHVHMLRKKTLVKDFIVCDLASDGAEDDIELGNVQHSKYDELPSNDSAESAQLHFFSSQQQRTLDRMGLM